MNAPAVRPHREMSDWAKRLYAMPILERWRRGELDVHRAISLARFAEEAERILHEHALLTGGSVRVWDPGMGCFRTFGYTRGGEDRP